LHDLFDRFDHGADFILGRLGLLSRAVVSRAFALFQAALEVIAPRADLLLQVTLFCLVGVAQRLGGRGQQLLTACREPRDNRGVDPLEFSGDAVDSPSLDLGEMKSVDRMPAATSASMLDCILRDAPSTADTAAVIALATAVQSNVGHDVSFHMSG
jgi:hypothetical protein